MSNMLIFAGSSNPTLAEEIAYELHRPLGKAQVGKFADGEVNVQVNENVRGRDVYIVQSTSTPVNENLMELLLMVSAMRRASARTITAVVPYYGYKREIGSVSNWTHLMRLEQEADGEASEAVTNERGERGSTGGARTLPAFVPTKGVAAAAAAGDASAHRQPTPSDIILEATEPVGVLFRQYAASSPTASSASAAAAAAAAAGAAVKAVDVQHAEQPAAAPSAWTPSAQVGLPQVSIPIAAADVARMLEEMGVD
ncbi:ribose-phosphate pyrophosphokinase, partial [archaeon]